MGCHRKMAGCRLYLVVGPDSSPAEVEVDKPLDMEAAACNQSVDLPVLHTLDMADLVLV